MLLLLLLLLHRRGGGRQGVVCRPAAHTWSEGLASLLDGYPIPAIGSFSLSNAEPPCDPLFFEFGIELPSMRTSERSERVSKSIDRISSASLSNYTIPSQHHPPTQFAQNCNTSSGWCVATALLRSWRMAAYIGLRAMSAGVQYTVYCMPGCRR